MDPGARGQRIWRKTGAAAVAQQQSAELVGRVLRLAPAWSGARRCQATARGASGGDRLPLLTQPISFPESLSGESFHGLALR